MNNIKFSTDYWQRTESLIEFVPTKVLIPNVPVTAVKLFDIQKNKLLLVDTPKGWDIPGGHVEANETTDQALKREIGEETGGLLKSYEVVGQLLITTQKDNEYNLSYPKKSTIVMYAGRIENAFVDRNALRHEVTDIKWFPIKELPRLVPHWSSLSQEIVEYIANPPTGSRK